MLEHISYVNTEFIDSFGSFNITDHMTAHVPIFTLWCIILLQQRISINNNGAKLVTTDQCTKQQESLFPISLVYTRQD